MSKNRASEVWKEIKPFAIRDMNRMLDNKAGDSGDDLYAIILYDESAQKIKNYAANGDGLTAALAAAGSGDIVLVPAGYITGGPWTVGSGVELSGLGDNTVLVGTITNNGIINSLKIVGNLITTGVFNKVTVELSSGTGILQTGGYGNFSIVRMVGGDYGIRLVPSGTTHAGIFGIEIIHSGGDATAILIDGINATAYSCRFAGRIGGIVRNARRIANCVFECSLGNAFSHDSGTAFVNNCFFHAQNGIGVGLSVTAAGLSISDCGWTQGEIGLSLATLADGDRAKYNHTHDDLGISPYPYAENAPTAQTIPTSDGSGDAIHPSVLDMYVELGYGETWNGYRYWMGMTPFPSGNAELENPEIVASNDGNSWEVPSGLTNPITASPTPGHLADTELILGNDNKLYCFYIDVDGINVNICVKSSSDGVTWSSETIVLSLTNVACPVVLWDGTQYVLWYLNYNAATYLLKKRTSSSLTSGWSAEVDCTMNNVPTGKNVWNIDIVKRGSVYHGVFGLYDDPKPIYFGYSTDGVAWYLLDDPLLEVGAAGSWDDGFLYRATLVPTANGYDMWYSANDQLGAWANCGTGRTAVYLNNYGGVFADGIWKDVGDLAVGSGYNTAERLAIGTEGQHLVVSSGVPAWADNTVATAVSDLTDVDVTDLADGEILVYDLTTGKWLPETPAAGITVEEIDGTPSVSEVNTINVAKGALTDNGSGIVTIDFGKGRTAGDYTFYIAGALVSGSDMGELFIAPRDCTIQNVLIHLKNTGTSGSTVIDVQKNGTTIFTTQANRPTVLYNDTNGYSISEPPDVISLSQGDVLTFDIDGVAVGAEDLTIMVAMDVALQAVGAISDMNWFIDGNVSSGSNVGEAFIIPRDGIITGVYISCKDTGTSGSTIVDVQKNGTTIFTTQSNRPILDYNDTNRVAKSGLIEVNSVSENDIITIDIDEVAIGATNLSVLVVMNISSGTLGDLSDVDLTGIVDGETIVWDEANSKFIPGTAATDGSAIHDNQANEISAITEKVTPADNDLLLIEDSAASYAKKKLKISNLPAPVAAIGDYELIIDEDFTNLDDWSVVSGTWSVLGNVLSKTNTGMANLKYSAKQYITNMIASVDFMYPSSVPSENTTLGIMHFWDGNTTNGAAWAKVSCKTTTFSLHIEKAWTWGWLSQAVATAAAADTWYTLIAHFNGAMVTVSLVGLVDRIGTSMFLNDDFTPSFAPNYIGFRAGDESGAPVNFRNFKVWIPKIA